MKGKTTFLKAAALFGVCVIVMTLFSGCSGGTESSTPSSPASAEESSQSSFPQTPSSTQPEAIIESKAKVMETIYPTEDVVVADIVATEEPYGADDTGREDATKAIQKALNACAALGGGTVYLPAGQYKVTGSITIPAFVSLRGDWQDPDEGRDYGTIILAEVESVDASLPALFQLGGSAGVRGLTIYYPQQSLQEVKPYPFTFYVKGMGDGYMLQSIMDCTVINGYRGIGACVEEANAHEMLTIDNVKGTFLFRGAEAYNQADVGTWKNLTISSNYWAEAGEAFGAPDRQALETYLRKNATGLMLGDLEWTEFTNIRVSNVHTAFHIVKGKRIQFAGSLYEVDVNNCVYGIRVDDLDPRWGMLVAKSTISAGEMAVENKTEGLVKMAGVAIQGQTSGEVSRTEAELDGYTADYHKQPAKPSAFLEIVQTDRKGKTDCSQRIQEALDKVGAAGGGVVYLPGGKYRLDSPITVPAGVELRGCSSVPTREQSGNSKGTLILAYAGKDTADPDKDTALVTLNGENAGIRGVRFIYPENGVVSGVKPYPYAIRGKAQGVYAVNIGISGGYNGIDFRGCDGHFIKKLVCCCYQTAISAGGKDGYIEGCLQNGNMLYRDGCRFPGWPTSEGNIQAEVMNKVTRKNVTFIRLEEADGQKIFNTFAYGVKKFLTSKDSENTLVFNVGADNLADQGTLLDVSKGSLVAVNVMRYNGGSYVNKGSQLKLFNRLTILDKTEDTVDTTA